MADPGEGPSRPPTQPSGGPSRRSRAPSVAGSLASSRRNPAAPSVASFQTGNSMLTARPRGQNPRFFPQGAMTRTGPSGSVFEFPAGPDPSLTRETNRRLEQERKRKRLNDDNQRFIEMAATPIPKTYAEVVAGKFDITDSHTALPQIPEGDFEVNLYNNPSRPSYFFGRRTDSPQLNMWAQVPDTAGGHTGRYVMKVDVSDANSLQAMAQTAGVLAARRQRNIAVVTLDLRHHETDEQIRRYQEHLGALASAPTAANRAVKCCNCGKEGHTVKVCALPQPAVGKLRGQGTSGTISACPECNSKLHIIDDCAVVKAESLKYSADDTMKYVAEMLCWGCYNRPALKSERYFPMDLVAQFKNTGEMTNQQLVDCVANWVPWTEAFSRAMADPRASVALGESENHPMYITTYVGDIGAELPRDRFWTDMTVVQALELNKAGAFDHLRYLSKETRARPIDGDKAATMFEMLLMLLDHTDLSRPARVEGGALSMLVDDEIPKQERTVVSVPGVEGVELKLAAMQLLNPGTWSGDPTGISAIEEGEPVITNFLVFTPSEQCARLLDADPVMYQRVKRAVNKYRLKRPIDTDDFVEVFLGRMAERARQERKQQESAPSDEDVANEDAPIESEMDDILMGSGDSVPDEEATAEMADFLRGL